MPSLRKAPLKGAKFPFFAPLPASKRMATQYAGSVNGKFARVLCKDSIGKFLALPEAGYRVGTFTDRTPTGDALNVGKRFSINEKIGENPYILHLVPGTVIEMGTYDYANPAQRTEQVYKESVELFVPGHIPVWQMLYWISNQVRYYVGPTGNSEDLPDYTDLDPLTKIAAITTPHGRKYNIRSPLIVDAKPVVLPTASPSPSPTP